jgi:hypothetical protein
MTHVWTLTVIFDGVGGLGLEEIQKASGFAWKRQRRRFGRKRYCGYEIRIMVLIVIVIIGNTNLIPSFPST